MTYSAGTRDARSFEVGFDINRAVVYICLTIPGNDQKLGIIDRLCFDIRWCL